jgi:hypothetical protein
MKLTAVLDFFGTDIAIECVLSALNDVRLLYSSLLLRLLLSCSDLWFSWLTGLTPNLPAMLIVIVLG